MLDKIKEVVFIYEDYITDEYDDCDVLSSNLFLIKDKNNNWFTGHFRSNFYPIGFEFQGITIGEFLQTEKDGLIDNANVVFLGQDGYDGNEIELEIKDIVFILPVNNEVSMSNSINNDLEQPQRAVSNYLICESSNTKFTQKEFYQMVIDSAQHELSLI